MSTNDTPLDDRISFSGFYSKQQAAGATNKSIRQLLPFLADSVNSAAMVRHCIHVVKDITEKLNPGQTSVLTGDQPVHALGKQVQWMFPDELSNIVWMAYQNDCNQFAG